MTAVAAIDLGSSSGRVVLGRLDEGSLHLREVHRFAHRAVDSDGVLHWDLETLTREIDSGIDAALHLADGSLASVAVDTWGVDYVLQDATGAPVLPARSYRDPRTASLDHPISAPVGRGWLWERTGIQPDPINTSHQLVADVRDHPIELHRAVSALMLSDHLIHHLSGETGWTRTSCSTSGLTRPGATTWDPEVLDAVGVPASWFGEIFPDRTVAGALLEHPDTQVVRAGGHDTACAVHALPTTDARDVFISSGSWSLVGIQREDAILSTEALRAGLTNEVRTDGGIRALKNVTGLWILQECQRVWQRTGARHEITELLSLARTASGVGVVFDPNHDDFRHPGDMPTIVSDHLRRKHGTHLESQGQVVRVILESLAAAYARTVREVTDIAGVNPRRIHIVGGGARNELLCEMTAAATGLPVHVGPSECTALGNVLAQLETLGHLGGESDRHRLVADRFAEEPTTYPAGMGAYFAAMPTIN